MPLRRGLPEKQAALLAHKEFVNDAERRSAKYFPCLDAAPLTGDQHICASFTLRKDKVPMLLHDKRVAKRNHKQHAQQPASKRQRKNPPVIQRIAEEDQRRQRKNRAGCNGFARRAHRLHDVVLKDRGLAEPFEDCDGNDGNGN